MRKWSKSIYLHNGSLAPRRATGVAGSIFGYNIGCTIECRALGWLLNIERMRAGVFACVLVCVCAYWPDLASEITGRHSTSACCILRSGACCGHCLVHWHRAAEPHTTTKKNTTDASKLTHTELDRFVRKCIQSEQARFLRFRSRNVLRMICC